MFPLQKQNCVEQTSPQWMWTLWTSFTSQHWKRGSSYCRPFIMSCTLPPAVPKELTPCLVRLYHHTTNTHLHGQLAKNRSRGCALMCLFSPESLGNNNVETFTATLASMSKSKSSPHVGCLSMNRRSLKLRYIHAYAQQKTKKKTSFMLISWPSSTTETTAKSPLDRGVLRW